MWDVRVCAACLATDVRMYSMSATSLLEPYRLLTGIESQSEGIPQKLCFECVALVHKFNIFRDKCERASLLLQDIYNQHDEITVTMVMKIDRRKHNLISPYTQTEIHNESHGGQVRKHNLISPYTQTEIHNESHGGQVKKRKKESTSSVKHEFEIKIVKVESESCVTEAVATELVEDATVKTETIDVCEVKLESEFDSSVFEDVDFDEPKQFEKARQTSRKRSRVEPAPEAEGKRRAGNVNPKDFNSTEIIVTEELARQLFVDRKNCKSFQKAKYKCSLCFRTFLEERFYTKHETKHKPSYGRYQCDICKLRFKQKQLLSTHFAVQHTKKYKCNICSKISSTRNRAKEHARSHKRAPLPSKKETKKSPGKVGRKKTMDYDITTVNLTQEQMMEVIRERRFSENYTMSKFKCALCYRGFREDKTYNNHMLLHDPSTGELECDICRFRMKTRGRVHKHITNYHLRKYICNICSNVNYSQDGARIHYMYHTGVQYPCHICGEKFRKMSSRLNHLRIKHPSDHVCGVCSESFVSPLGLTRHARLMHSMKQCAEVTASEGGAYCETCDIRFTSERAHTRHKLISPKHEQERSGILNGCRDCGNTFKTWIELKAHRRAVHPAKKLRPGTTRHAAPRAPWQDKPCIQCGEVMTSDRKYRGHFQVKHPGDPWPFTELIHPFICEICGKGFNCNANLIAHRNFHTGTRAYKCDICPKSFYLPFNLKQHYIAHSEERPHVCHVCRRGFKVKNGLERHMRSHTGEKPYDCTTCGKPFSSSTGRNSHMRAVHHKEPPLAAPFHRRRARPEQLQVAQPAD